MQPFENQIVRLTISGRKLRLLLEQTLGTIHVSGMHITYDPRGRRGSRIADALLADSEPIADGGTYTLAVSDFMAEGGGGFTMLRDLPREDTGVQDLDALITYLQGAPQPFAIPSDRRIVPVNR